MRTPKYRIALVMEVNKGIGFEIARQLGKEGGREAHRVCPPGGLLAMWTRY